MAFTVEDGTGVPGANSYIAVAFADDYWADRGDTTWAALTTAEKESLLIRASSFLDAAYYQHYRGQRKTQEQGLAWPRTGVTDCDGFAVADNVVPLPVQKATAELALKANSTAELMPDSSTTGQVIEETVDVLTVRYSDKWRASSQVVYRMADALLAPLLLGCRGLGGGAAVNFNVCRG